MKKGSAARVGAWVGGYKDNKESIICVYIYLVCDYATVSQEQIRKKDKVSTWMTKFAIEKMMS